MRKRTKPRWIILLNKKNDIRPTLSEPPISECIAEQYLNICSS